MDDEKELDDLNGRIADAVLEDGRVFFGSTVVATGRSRSDPRP